MTILVIDGGASAAKWQLRSDDGVLMADGRTKPLHGHLFDTAARHASHSIITDLAAEVLRHGRPDVVVAGFTGLGSRSQPALWFHETLSGIFGLAAQSVLVADDLWFVSFGLLTPGRDLLVYAGTGAIACHVTTDLKVRRAGGYGYLVDDPGGGFWIGSHSVRWWLRRLETGDAVSGVLNDLLTARFGSTEWNAIRPQIYEGGRSFLASLTHEVTRAAEAGDTDAIRILADAGTELGAMANRLLRATGISRAEAYFAGGIVACGAFVKEPLISALDPAISFASAVVDNAEAFYRAAAKYGPKGLSDILAAQ